MQRDPSLPVEGGFEVAPLIMESAKELSLFAKFLPDTADLPTTHEHFVETRTEKRNGQEITVKYVGVRVKQAAATVAGKPAHEEPDKLNAMNDAELETEAAKVGVANYPKSASKAKRVAAIREAMTVKV